MFSSRWLLAPFYLGLVLAIVLLLARFVQEFLHLAPRVLEDDGGEVIVGILSLVDVALVANLLLIIVFAGYESFVSKIQAAEHEDRPDWMGKVDFSDLKIKLIGSMAAISGIELLKALMKIDSLTTEELAWKVGIHLTFVVSGVLFALMDRLGRHGPAHGKAQGH
jgi:uncharacterized protein (TIGR00645 family)